jgi:hypothetical protein
MRLDQHRHTLIVAVTLALLLGVITGIYLHQFPPPPGPVSCTTATGCAAPERFRPPPNPHDFK